jgi:hypothetical protein
MIKEGLLGTEWDTYLVHCLITFMHINILHLRYIFMGEFLAVRWEYSMVWA